MPFAWFLELEQGRRPFDANNLIYISTSVLSARSPPGPLLCPYVRGCMQDGSRPRLYTFPIWACAMLALLCWLVFCSFT